MKLFRNGISPLAVMCKYSVKEGPSIYKLLGSGSAPLKPICKWLKISCMRPSSPFWECCLDALLIILI